jgi:L-alanine-DL-glutamate epimerase-like enolase superfamily enzyme
MTIKKITGHVLSIPLKRPFTYFTASLAHLPYVLVVIETDSGIVGIGEAALAWDVTGETQAGALACLDLLRPVLVGSGIDSLACVRAIVERIELFLYGATALKTGIESALFDILGKHLNLPIYRLLGGHEKARITLQRTFSFEELLLDTLAFARDAYAGGVRVFKYKVGRDSQKECEAMYRVRDTYPDITITLDANQAWKTVESACAFLNEVEGARIAWIEQPLRATDYDGLALLRKKTRIPVMADESCHTLHDVTMLYRCNAIDFVNIKLAKCGGLFELTRMIEFCDVHDIGYALGDMIHSSVGTAYNLHAATLGNFITYDLTLPERIARDVGTGVVFEGYSAYIPSAPGLGVYLSDFSNF